MSGNARVANLGKQRNVGVCADEAFRLQFINTDREMVGMVQVLVVTSGCNPKMRRKAHRAVKRWLEGEGRALHDKVSAAWDEALRAEAKGQA